MTNKRDKLSRREKIVYLPLNEIEANKNQPRRRFDDKKLCELAESIRENGLLQPITVRKSDNKTVLIAGERRLRACHIAGLREIPCIVVEADDTSSATLALLENLQRADLGFFEEAQGISRLMRLCGYTQEQVSKKLGITQAAVSNKLRILRLSPEVLDTLLAAELTERHARALLRLSSREEQLAAATHIAANSLNVREAEEYVDILLSQASASRAATKTRSEKYVIKDVRLFCNTVGRALETMRRAGFRADLERREDESSINMSIRIFK